MTTLTFDPKRYGPAVAQLIDPEQLGELGPGRPNRDLREKLANLSEEDVVRGPIRDHDMARCCLAGIWLWHDFLDESHTISQSISSASGSYWHGVMHRREPDYSNAKYWFRRVGEHPIFGPLVAAAGDLAQQDAPPEAAWLREGPAWDPYRFIDLCQAAARRGGGLEELCRRVARAEWFLLFDFCHRHAGGD